MNVASFELCRELSELSGWRTDCWQAWFDSGPDDEPYASQWWGDEPGFLHPAYDLGYLREKLVTSPIPQLVVEKALYEGVDATAKLCIECIKSGDIYVEPRKDQA